MVLIYCLKCKDKTETLNVKMVKTKNNRNMMKGECAVCHTKKSLFVSDENAKKSAKKSVKKSSKKSSKK